MGLRIEFEKPEEKINYKLTILGLIFFAWRVYAMNSLKTIEGGWAFEPDVLHTSYFISLCMCLSMIFSFRVKPLNAVPLTIYPSVLITVPMKDIPILLNPEIFGTLFWFNYLSIHIPVVFFGIYMLIARREYINRSSFLLSFLILFAWYWCIDNKSNGVLNGWDYVAVGLPLALVWFVLSWFWLLKDCDPKSDPLIAPIYIFKKFVWVSKTQSEAKVSQILKEESV